MTEKFYRPFNIISIFLILIFLKYFFFNAYQLWTFKQIIVFNINKTDLWKERIFKLLIGISFSKFFKVYFYDWVLVLVIFYYFFVFRNQWTVKRLVSGDCCSLAVKGITLPYSSTLNLKNSSIVFKLVVFPNLLAYVYNITYFLLSNNSFIIKVLSMYKHLFSCIFL